VGRACASFFELRDEIVEIEFRGGANFRSSRSALLRLRFGRFSRPKKPTMFNPFGGMRPAKPIGDEGFPKLIELSPKAGEI